jgi:hypothetical protein
MVSMSGLSACNPRKPGSATATMCLNAKAMSFAAALRTQVESMPVDYENLMPFIQETVRPGSPIHSDGSPAYRNLEELGYQRRRSVHLGSDTPAHESMPGVHRVAALLQRWLLGTHHGAVQPGQSDTTSMSLSSGLTGGYQFPEDFCSIDCFSKRSSRSR